jgi:uncharacterized protein (TIGR02588 family)
MSGERGGGDDGARPTRSPAEWVTFAVALAIVAVVAGLIVREIPGSKRPPEPVAEAAPVEARGDRFVVPVVVRNDGEQTAENVQVSATLTIDGAETTGDQTVDFLAGGEEQDLEFVFADDPGDGELEVEVTGYLVP